MNLLQKCFQIGKRLPYQRFIQNQQYSFGQFYPAHIKLFLPTLLPEMHSGKINKWYVNVGDDILPDDLICDIETNKATIGYVIEEVENENKKMFVAKILIEEDVEIDVGTCIAICVDSRDDISAFQNYEQIDENKNNP